MAAPKMHIPTPLTALKRPLHFTRKAPEQPYAVSLFFEMFE